MQIGELRDGLSNVELSAKVIEVAEPREVTTKFGTSIAVTEATMEDETGKVTLVLWGKQAEGASVGKSATVKGGFVKSWKGRVQLSVGRGGSVTFE